MAERKWKKISAWMAAGVMAVVFAVSGAQTAFAATSYVNSVSITLDVTPTVGESLPDLDVGYNSDNCEVSELYPTSRSGRDSPTGSRCGIQF